MSWFKRFFNLDIQEWWKQPVDNFDPDQVVCTVDDEVVSCSTWEAECHFQDT